jgi:hypothetical protein
MTVPPVPSRAAPAAAISSKGQPVIGSPLGLGGLGGGLDGARLGLGVAVDGDVGDTDGEGVGDPDGEGVGVPVGVGAGHATQNTFCLAKPCSPVKFQ